MYKLPSGKKINEDAVLKIMLDLGSPDIFYLDAETGEVVKSGETINCRTGNYEGRYFRIPKLTESHIILWMEELARELIVCENPLFATSLLSILQKDEPINNFMAAIEGDWSYGWPQWEADLCYEEYEDWLDKLPFTVEDDWQEFFEENCDCPICKAMAKGRDDLESLQDAFREANFKQVIEDINSKQEN